MKTFHHVTLRVFVKEYQGDSLDESLECFHALVPLDFEKEKLVVEHEKATRYDNRTPIHILQLRLEKQRHMKAFITHLFEQLGSDQLKELRSHHVDEECYFYLRLDRKKFDNGTYVLTTAGDCIHIRFLLAAYPASQKRGEELLRVFLSKQVKQ